MREQGFRPLTTGFEPARHLQAKIQSSTEEGDRRKNLFEAPQINHSGRSPLPYLAETLETNSYVLKEHWIRRVLISSLHCIFLGLNFKLKL